MKLTQAESRRAGYFCGVSYCKQGQAILQRQLVYFAYVPEIDLRLRNVTYWHVVCLDIQDKRSHIYVSRTVDALMPGGTYTSSFVKFGSFVVRRFPRREDASWSHGTKIALWVGLASASWAVFVVAGYLIWSVL